MRSSKSALARAQNGARRQAHLAHVAEGKVYTSFGRLSFLDEGICVERNKGTGFPPVAASWRNTSSPAARHGLWLQKKRKENCGALRDAFFFFFFLFLPEEMIRAGTIYCRIILCCTTKLRTNHKSPYYFPFFTLAKRLLSLKIAPRGSVAGHFSCRKIANTKVAGACFCAPGSCLSSGLFFPRHCAGRRFAGCNAVREVPLRLPAIVDRMSGIEPAATLASDPRCRLINASAYATLRLP